MFNSENRVMYPFLSVRAASNMRHTQKGDTGLSMRAVFYLKC